VTTLVPLGDIERMSMMMAKSGLFGVRTPEQAASLMLIAQAEGLHPAIACRDYHVIQGRPALKSDAMLARFQQAGGRVEWTEYTDRRVAGKFSHPQGGSIEVDWTIERAKGANLTNKDTWRQYPRQMLRARVISEGIRAVFPGVVVGTYSVEEVQDMASPAVVVATEPQLADPLAGINAAETLDELKGAYVAAVKAAKKAKDGALAKTLEAAKDARKAEIEAATVSTTEVIE
jgi:hypothetical protein